MRDVIAIWCIRAARRLTTSGCVFDKLGYAESHQAGWADYVRDRVRPLKRDDYEDEQ